MDSPRHARSSSSQSVKITELFARKRGRPGEEISVSLSDASSFFVSRRVWEEAPFHEGDELSDEQWERILERSRDHAAYYRALDLLAGREHSRFLLSRKLIQKGCEPDSVERALNALQDAGYLDDRRFAESWARSRLRSHPEGRTLLLAHLRERGVAREDAEAAVAAVLREDEQALVEAARAVVDRLTRRKARDVQEIRHRLFQRGFSADVISMAVKSLEPDDIDNPTEFEG